MTVMGIGKWFLFYIDLGRFSFEKTAGGGMKLLLSFLPFIGRY